MKKCTFPMLQQTISDVVGYPNSRASMIPIFILSTKPSLGPKIFGDVGGSEGSLIGNFSKSIARISSLKIRITLYS